MSADIQGFRAFEFDLPEALLASLIVVFDGMEAASLTRAHLEGVPDAQGVYQLLLGQDIVYIGKTDSESGLTHRLSRHAYSIQHRLNLSVADVRFKAVRVLVFSAMDLETQLIKHYKGKFSTSWNQSGFGSNDPGRNRDKTKATQRGFDMLYPINLDEPVRLRVSGVVSVPEALQALRDALPYTVRVQSADEAARKPHPDLVGLRITVPDEQTMVSRTLRNIIDVCPPGWQATALSGRIVMYKERDDSYPGARVIARS